MEIDVATGGTRECGGKAGVISGQYGEDGDEFKPVPAFELKTETIPLSGETISYNQAFDTSQRVIDFTVVLENPTKEFVVRQICCSAYQVNDKWFGYPNVKCVSRIAGDPNNIEKPLPQMDMLL